MTNATAWLTATLMLLGFLPSAMAKSHTWQCVYTQRASPDGLANDNLSLEFAVDDITGKAVIIGNLGVADVEAHHGSSSVTFIERLNTGVVQTTTIAKDGRSVHSRHTIFGGVKFIPSQSYGQCNTQR
jgi:hypothetical protein